MNKTEFAALPPDLQRDVRCAVAIGWPMESHTRRSRRGVEVKEGRLQAFPWRRWNPTQSREIWAGLLEAFPITLCKGLKRKYSAWLHSQHDYAGTEDDHLPAAIVLEVIRRDPLGHLKRSGL